MPEPAEVVRLVAEGSEDPQVQAAKIIAAAVDRALDRFGPAADTVAGFGHRLDALCAFLRKRGPWVLASIPVVLTSIGAITPDAAKGIHALILAFAGH